MSAMTSGVNTWEGDPDAASRRLRGSVTTLRLLVEGLHDGIVDPARDSQDTADMLTHVRLVSDLVGALSGASPIPHQGVRRLSLQRLLTYWVTALRPTATIASIELSLDVPQELAAVRGDGRDLSRVVLTLVHNAIRHSPVGSTVVVRAGEVGESVEVRVDDGGPGIAAAARRRILDATPDGQGAAPGWGLPVARAIVAAHGGRLWIDESEVGASLRFRLPAVRA
jgi:signal transduction histidine kinase